MLSALRIIKEHPNYELFHNNCQNFSTYLLTTLCPEASLPDTIEAVLGRLQDAFSTASDSHKKIPGAYPCSLQSSISFESSMTSSAETWYTASGTTWITAISVISPGNSIGGSSSQTCKRTDPTRTELCGAQTKPNLSLVRFGLVMRLLGIRSVRDSGNLIYQSSVPFSSVRPISNRSQIRFGLVHWIRPFLST
jgi:hypothetical protein